MKENSLILLLKSTSKKELKEFDKFLRSPYFMEGKNLRSKLLYDYFCILKEAYPEFSRKKTEQETLFRRMYPGKKFSPVLMRRLDSDLGKMVIKFFEYGEYKQSPVQQSINTLNALSKKNLDKLLIKTITVSENIAGNQKYNSNHYHNLLQISSVKNHYAYIKDDWLKYYDLKSEADNFTSYTLCRSLEIYRNIENDKAILNFSYDTRFFEILLQYLKTNSTIIENNEYAAMHYYEIMMNIEKTDNSYYMLKRLKNKLIKKLSEDTLRNLYITLVNYCIRKTNIGFTEFRIERFELDKEIMENDIHNKFEYFDMNYFLSTVRNAVSLKKLDWAEKFIENYKDRLEQSHKMFALNFAMGVLNYGKKNYFEALDNLSRINVELSTRKQQIKNLMLVIYCETGSYENALNIIDTNKHSLKTDKQIPEARKKTFVDFLTFTNSYIKLMLKPDEADLYALIKKINETRYFAYKEWLLEKLDGMKNPK